MLVLGRKAQEAILIRMPCGREVRVVYIGHRGGNNARLGIEAPPEVEVMREELADLDAEFRAAVKQDFSIFAERRP